MLDSEQFETMFHNEAMWNQDMLSYSSLVIM